MIPLFLAAMWLCTCASTARRAFYTGILFALLTIVPQLWFFASVFGAFSVALFAIVSWWYGLFTFLGYVVRKRWGNEIAVVLLPVLWTGIEYFRGEVYYLRFSWLSVGYAWPTDHSIGSGALSLVGVYGIGFACMLLVCLVLAMPRNRSRLIGLGTLTAALVAITHAPVAPKVNVATRSGDQSAPRFAVLQLEFPGHADLREGLDGLLTQAVKPDLIILSEYTFGGLPPAWLEEWCREQSVYVIAGGKRFAENVDTEQNRSFANTAFVIDPNGEVVFEQVKSVPVQFFSDGVPAQSLKLWQSPWGPIGICICYDLSYRDVVDEIVRLGARALIVPTMDVESWGEHEHRLHTLIGPTRSREYDLPVVRACSSGISQFIENGVVRARAGFPGQGETISGVLELADVDRSPPIDRYLAPLLMWLSALIISATVCFPARPRR